LRVESKNRKQKAESRKLKVKREGNFTEGNEGNQGMSEDKVLDKVLDKVAWGRIES
jgi:hypothetical protein